MDFVVWQLTLYYFDTLWPKMIQPLILRRGLVRLCRNGFCGLAEMANTVWKFKLLSSLTDILWPKNNTTMVFDKRFGEALQKRIL